jgi:hypothetical protein
VRPEPHERPGRRRARPRARRDGEVADPDVAARRERASVQAASRSTGWRGQVSATTCADRRPSRRSTTRRPVPRDGPRERPRDGRRSPTAGSWRGRSTSCCRAGCRSASTTTR